MKRILIAVLLFLTVFKLSLFLWINQINFLEKFDPVYYSKLYSQSQYILGPLSKGGIGDDGLYAYAGYYYLFQGGDVSNVNFEHPPLGKYLIGVSEFVFQNENMINVIYFVALLILTYKISQLLKDDRLLAVFCVFLLSLDNLFLDNLLRSLLDLPFTLFFVGAVYFFIKALSKRKFFLHSGLFWGMAFSTRFFPSLLFLYLFMFIIIFIYRKKDILFFSLSAIMVPVIYMLNHISFFIYHPSFIEFLRHKKWMLAWFSGTTISPGNIFRNIFTGKYLDSTGSLAVNEYWMPVIPVIVTLGIIIVGKDIFIKKNIHRMFLYGLTLIFLLYVAFLTGGVQKFIMPIYPLLVILAVHNSNRLYSIIRAWMKVTFCRSKTRL